MLDRSSLGVGCIERNVGQGGGYVIVRRVSEVAGVGAESLVLLMCRAAPGAAMFP